MIFTLATYNMLGGRGVFSLSKQLCRMVIMPFIVWQFMGFGLYNAAVIFGGFALWAVFGHGKYFGEIWYGFNKIDDVEIRWIDWVGRKVLPMRHVARGVLSMGLRGMFLYPMFVLLDAPIIGLGMMLQGFCYLPDRYFDFSGDGVLSEFLTGLLISCLILGIEF